MRRAGDRISPTHTNRKGTRYPYYISQSLIKLQTWQDAASHEDCRVPASDLETIVDDEIVRLMHDGELIHEVAGPSSVAQRKKLITQAAPFAERWPRRSPSGQRAIASALIESVVVAPKEVALTVRLDAIRHITPLTSTSNVCRRASMGRREPCRSQRISSAPAWKPSYSSKAPLGPFEIMPIAVSSV